MQLYHFGQAPSLSKSYLPVDKELREATVTGAIHCVGNP